MSRTGPGRGTLAGVPLSYLVSWTLLGLLALLAGVLLATTVLALGDQVRASRRRDRGQDDDREPARP